MQSNSTLPHTINFYRNKDQHHNVVAEIETALTVKGIYFLLFDINAKKCCIIYESKSIETPIRSKDSDVVKKLTPYLLKQDVFKNNNFRLYCSFLNTLFFL